MAKAKISNSDLMMIALQRLRKHDDCPTNLTIAIVPAGADDWSILTNFQTRKRYPELGKRIQSLQRELGKRYRLSGDE